MGDRVKPEDVRHGQAVRLDATVTDRDGQRIHGKRGVVEGSNALHRRQSDGKLCANVKLEEEGLVSVPIETLRKRG